jgi:hypothetical protein
MAAEHQDDEPLFAYLTSLEHRASSPGKDGQVWREVATTEEDALELISHYPV